MGSQILALLLSIPLGIIGLAGRVIQSLFNWLRMPVIEFYSPVNRPPENGVAWWQVSVSLRRQWLTPEPLRDVSVEIVLVGDVRRTYRMCWLSKEGARERMTLHYGEVYDISVAARSTNGTYQLTAVPGGEVYFNVHPRWYLRTGITRLTDAKHFLDHTGEAITDFTASRDYTATIRLRIGLKEVAKSSYWISVPALESPNSEFIIKAEN